MWVALVHGRLAVRQCDFRLSSPSSSSSSIYFGQRPGTVTSFAESNFLFIDSWPCSQEGKRRRAWRVTVAQRHTVDSALDTRSRNPEPGHSVEAPACMCHKGPHPKLLTRILPSLRARPPRPIAVCMSVGGPIPRDGPPRPPSHDDGHGSRTQTSYNEAQCQVWGLQT